jgi:hypothetical protein
MVRPVQRNGGSNSLAAAFNVESEEGLLRPGDDSFAKPPAFHPKNRRPLINWHVTSHAPESLRERRRSLRFPQKVWGRKDPPEP